MNSKKGFSKNISLIYNKAEDSNKSNTDRVLKNDLKVTAISLVICVTVAIVSLFLLG